MLPSRPSRGWAVLSSLVGILILLGGLLPGVAHPTLKLVDGTTGIILIGALSALFALISFDLARGIGTALAAAGGLGAIVVCMAGIVGSFFWQTNQHGGIHLSPGAGSVCIFAAGGGGLILALVSLSRLPVAATYSVHPPLAILAGAGGTATVVALCIPPLRGTSVHDYLLKGPGFVVFWALAPFAVISFCALAATLARTAGGMMLILGSAAGLLVWWGVDEVVRSEPIPFSIFVHHGNWVAVLIALSVTILAAATALLPRTDHAVAVTPTIVLAAATVFVVLLVVHHSHSDGLRLVAPDLHRPSLSLSSLFAI